MKVLRVINSLHIGGAERSILNNVPEHVKHGYHMDVLLLNGEATFFKEKLEKKGIKVFALANHKGGLGLYNPFHIFKIMKYLKQYDIVHAHLFPTLYWVSLAGFFSSHKPLFVYTEHNTENRRRKNIPLLKQLETFIYKRFSAIITITPETKETLLKHINFNKKVYVVYNGINLQDYNDQLKPYKFPVSKSIKNPYFLVQVAGFREEKDQDTLIKSLKYLPENYVAVFVGDGKRRAFCEALAAKEQVLDRTIFMGIQQEVPSIMKAADIVIMSSIFEGFGRTAVEGMAAGKPVIGSDVAGLAQVIGDSGLLFKVSDAKALANQVTLLSSDNELYSKLSKRSLERAKMFSKERMITGYEQVYQDLIRDRA